MEKPLKDLDTLQLKEFSQIASDAGQNIRKIVSGETKETYFRIATMPEMKRILSQATEQERKKRSETFLKGLEYRNRIPQGMHDRGEAYIFSDHPLASKETIEDTVITCQPTPVPPPYSIRLLKKMKCGMSPLDPKEA